jgi:HrpA-like RNA helicase
MSNITLPVYAQRNEIVSAVRDNSVVIITAETGAGKSTQVPQYLLEEGYNLVVTQPRRLAARTVAARVAEECNTPLGDVVGLRTAYERQDSEATRCLFATDGLALVRELMGAGSHSVLVIDEVHEWNLNIEVLVAWARRQIDAGSPFKVVLMSATLEADRLSAYFGGAPIVNVPGRTFPVEEQVPAGRELEDDVATPLQQGRNVLVFQPGKGEITETIAELTRRAGLGQLNAEILPLHGELTPEEQARCFRTYSRPKCVVSTNVAQTSVTIPGIDVVVDAGTERRTELVDGIEGLYLKAISLADREQRKGRAGRTKPGVYIDWCSAKDRPAFPLAEILRVRLDQTVLRLAEAGIDAEELTFFHQPDVAEIREAKRALVALGCMDARGEVTRVGRRVAKLPISVKYGRMIVEGERLGVVDDVVTVAAIMEQGGIVARLCPTHKREGLRDCRCWQRLAPGETGSDVVAQLTAYKACGSMTREEMREGGIFAKAFYQAKEKRRHLADALRGKVKEFNSSDRREDILKAICAGMVDHLYRSEGGGYYRNGGGSRQLGRESVVVSAHWLVGEPWDLQIQTRRGPQVLALVKMCSAIDPAWLAEVAPQLVTVKVGVNARYDSIQDDVVSTTETWFNGQQIESREALDPTHDEAARLRREGRITGLWQSWVNRPEIAIPDPSDTQAVIPDILVDAYGVDKETGEQLLAYGTVAKREWFRQQFVVAWRQSLAEAEALHAEACSRLEVLHAEAEIARLRESASPLREQLAKLRADHGYSHDISEKLRDGLYHASNPPYTSGLEAMETWAKSAEALIAQLNEELEILPRLAATARSLRDEVNGLLLDHEKELDDTQYDLLAELDVDDAQLPTRRLEIERWIKEAEKRVNKTRKFLEATGGDPVAALAARFNQR